MSSPYEILRALPDSEALDALTTYVENQASDDVLLDFLLERSASPTEAPEPSTKHYFGQITEHVGEFEFTSKFVFSTDGDPVEHINDLAATYRSDDSDDDEDEDAIDGEDGDYLTCGGAVRTKTSLPQEISPEDFAVLQKYLSTL